MNINNLRPSSIGQCKANRGSHPPTGRAPTDSDWGRLEPRNGGADGCPSWFGDDWLVEGQTQIDGKGGVFASPNLPGQQDSIRGAVEPAIHALNANNGYIGSRINDDDITVNQADQPLFPEHLGPPSPSHGQVHYSRQADKLGIDRLHSYGDRSLRPGSSAITTCIDCEQAPVGVGPLTSETALCQTCYDRWSHPAAETQESKEIFQPVVKHGEEASGRLIKIESQEDYPYGILPGIESYGEDGNDLTGNQDRENDMIKELCFQTPDSSDQNKIVGLKFEEDRGKLPQRLQTRVKQEPDTNRGPMRTLESRHENYFKSPEHQSILPAEMTESEAGDWTALSKDLRTNRPRRPLSREERSQPAPLALAHCIDQARLNHTSYVELYCNNNNPAATDPAIDEHINENIDQCFREIHLHLSILTAFHAHTHQLLSSSWPVVAGACPPRSKALAHWSQTVKEWECKIPDVFKKPLSLAALPHLRVDLHLNASLDASDQRVDFGSAAVERHVKSVCLRQMGIQFLLEREARRRSGSLVVPFLRPDGTYVVDRGRDGRDGRVASATTTTTTTAAAAAAAVIIAGRECQAIGLASVKGQLVLMKMWTGMFVGMLIQLREEFPLW